MSDFDLEVKTVTVFRAPDGVEFTNKEEALKYIQDLKQAAAVAAEHAKIECAVNSYANFEGLDGRNRAQKSTVIRKFLEWYMNWDGEFIPEPEPEPIVMDGYNDQLINTLVKNDDEVEMLDPFVQDCIMQDAAEHEQSLGFDPETGEVFDDDDKIKDLPF